MNELKRELINELIQLHEYLSKLTKFQKYFYDFIIKLAEEVSRTKS